MNYILVFFVYAGSFSSVKLGYDKPKAMGILLCLQFNKIIELFSRNVMKWINIIVFSKEYIQGV